MKNVFRLSSVAIMLTFVTLMGSSCEKIKERKEFKKTYGNYICDDSVYICTFPDSTDLYAKELSISENGIGFLATENCVNQHMSVFYKAEGNDNSSYDYQLILNKTQLFGISEEQGMYELPSYSESYLNAGRKFYLHIYSENAIDFVIVYDSGEIEAHTLKK